MLKDMQEMKISYDISVTKVWKVNPCGNFTSLFTMKKRKTLNVIFVAWHEKFQLKERVPILSKNKSEQ